MIVGVSIRAYAAGMFQLMTHAFFKALLFMAAGSVISAMAGTQDINRMGGLRKAMPITSKLMIIGALALAAFPFMSGFFSKDEILGYAIHRGGFYVIFAIGGYSRRCSRPSTPSGSSSGSSGASPCPRRRSSSTDTSPTPRPRTR